VKSPQGGALLGWGSGAGACWASSCGALHPIKPEGAGFTLNLTLRPMA